MTQAFWLAVTTALAASNVKAKSCILGSSKYPIDRNATRGCQIRATEWRTRLKGKRWEIASLYILGPSGTSFVKWTRKLAVVRFSGSSVMQASPTRMRGAISSISSCIYFAEWKSSGWNYTDEGQGEKSRLDAVFGWEKFNARHDDALAWIRDRISAKARVSCADVGDVWVWMLSDLVEWQDSGFSSAWISADLKREGGERFSEEIVARSNDILCSVLNADHVTLVTSSNFTNIEQIKLSLSLSPKADQGV